MLEKIKELIADTPHSEGRVPFTYHHDYLREHTKRFRGASRSDIAAQHESTEIELYALCAMQIVNHLDVEVLLPLFDKHKEAIEYCVGVSLEKIKFYDKNL